MTGIEKVRRAYRIDVEKSSGAEGLYRVLFHPRSLQHVAIGGARRKVPDPHVVDVRVVSDDAIFPLAENHPHDPEAAHQDFLQEAVERVTILDQWLSKLNSLAKTVEDSARRSGWQTRIVGKKMEDSEIGAYSAPALLMQADAVQLRLDPIARSTPGAEGVADLYLVPAYDDIATFLFYEGLWHVHYPFASSVVAGVREGQALPATRTSVLRVLDKMKRDAG